MSDLNDKKHNTPEESESSTCPVTGHQKVGICVPVTVTPFRRTGEIKTKCCGDPVIRQGSAPCPGSKNGIAAFTVSQTICVEIPLSLGAITTVADPYVDNLGVSTEDICRTCKNPR